MDFTRSSVTLIDWMGDDMRACHAARVSFLKDSYPPAAVADPPAAVADPPAAVAELAERDKRLLAFLMREQHTSPFEHSTITFRICAPLPVCAQIMRHRTFSYNQSSRRYTSDKIEFFNVEEWRKQSAKNLQCSDGALESIASAGDMTEMYQDHCARSYQLYQIALEMGVSREQARFILPQGLMAEFWMTGNLMNFFKFLRLRDSDHAQLECREVASAIKEELQKIFPESCKLFFSASASAEEKEG